MSDVAEHSRLQRLIGTTRPRAADSRRSQIAILAVALLATMACTGLTPPPAVPPAQSPQAVPDHVVRDLEGDARLQRREWFAERRRGPDGRVPPDLLDREVKAWRAWAATHALTTAATAQPSPFTNKTWQERGPFNIAGRVLSVAIDPSNPNAIWAGSAGGGLYHSFDFGQTWQQVGGDDLPSLWIGGIAVDPNHPAVVYMGTGEDNTNYGGYGGFGGMLKTTDGGATFSQLALPPSSSFGLPSSFIRTIVSPANSKLVVTASDVGVYRSADAGATFALTTLNPYEQNISDLGQDPDNPSRFIAVVSGGFGSAQSGLLESLDEGVTWRSLGTGLPAPGQWGRAAFAFGPAGSGIAFTAIAQKIGGSFPAKLFKSVDHGHTWTAVAFDNQNGYRGVGWYGAHLSVAPWDVNTVFEANGYLIVVSRDGGVTWTTPGGDWHVDTHGIALTPLDPTHIVFATDGGVAVSKDGGATFNRVDQNFRTVQYYSCAIGLNDSVTLFAGTQDNCLNVYRGDPGGAWDFSPTPGFCDDSGITVNPASPNEVLTIPAAMAAVDLSEDTGRTWTDTRNNGVPGADGGPWASRTARSVLNPQNVYIGAHYIEASSDGGHTWNPLNVRPDLKHTAEDVSVSPASGQEIWSIWDDAQVFVSEDGGATWQQRSPPPASRAFGNRISAGPTLGAAYAVLGGTSGPRLFRTHDGGSHWTDISGGLPDLALNAVVADPRQAGRLIVSTDAGVASSDDDGQTWHEVSGSLPRAVMWDLCLDPASGRLGVASYGRGMWELASPPACAASTQALCLSQGRFEVAATWSSGTAAGTAQVVQLTPDTGYLYFFDPSNVEAVVKVIDGCALNKEFWVFAGGLTNVQTMITVRDSLTGITKTYTNPQSTAFQPIQDTGAFATCKAADQPHPVDTPAEPVANRAGERDGLQGAAPGAGWLASNPDSVAGSSLLLNNDRFKVDVSWQTADGKTGTGMPVSVTGDTGYFWFFNSTAVEMVIKVLSGCGLNSKYWVFAGGLTNVQTTIKVTDTQTGAMKTYTNPQGKPFQPIQDTAAFVTCP